MMFAASSGLSAVQAVAMSAVGFTGASQFALVGILALFTIRGVQSPPNRAALLSTCLFAGYVLARAFFSPTAYLARFDIYSLLAGLIVYFVTALVVTDGRKRMLIIAILLPRMPAAITC